VTIAAGAALLLAGCGGGRPAVSLTRAAQVQRYYTAHRADYVQTTRQTRFILVHHKKLAETLEARLRSGQSFMKLARKYSYDRASASRGGAVTATKGQEIPIFDDVAFTLRTGATSAPVDAARYSLGWFIVRAVSPVTERLQPLHDVRDAILVKLGLTRATRSGSAARP
jgi:peptidyl-prolyl cis-trans isomerase C